MPAIKDLSEIFHNIESTKDKMLKADPNLGIRQFILSLCSHSYPVYIYFFWTFWEKVTYNTFTFPCKYLNEYFLRTRIFSHIMLGQLSNSGNLTLIQEHCPLYSPYPNFVNWLNNVLYIDFFLDPGSNPESYIAFNCCILWGPGSGLPKICLFGIRIIWGWLLLINWQGRRLWGMELALC